MSLEVSTILSNARIIDPVAGRVYSGSILIENGRIQRICEHPPSEINDAKEVDCRGNFLAPGIVDIGVKIGEPGERYKESFRTAGMAAAKGGVTTMVTRPDTNPPIDNPETLEFFVRRATVKTGVRVKPMATLTKGRNGKIMSEIGLLQDAGAVAFSDCDSVVENTKVMANCLTYCSQRGAIVVGHPQDPWLSSGTSASAGKFATIKGLTGVSPMAERISLERDLSLVEMTGAVYHADQVTTIDGIRRLREGIHSGLNVTGGISIHHLTMNELDVADYRTFFKVKPPLRSENDRLAAVEAVADGVISIISSMHTPQDEESKRLPFEEAASGAVALETLLPAALLLYHSGDLELPTLFRAMSYNPSQRLGLETGRIERGAPADLIIFDSDHPFRVDRFRLSSKSKNTPFDGQVMQGRIIRTIVGGTTVYKAK